MKSVFTDDFTRADGELGAEWEPIEVPPHKMTEQEYRELFASLTLSQLIEAAVNLALDADRLRAELDKSKGVIR